MKREKVMDFAADAALPAFMAVALLALRHLLHPPPMVMAALCAACILAIFKEGH